MILTFYGLGDKRGVCIRGIMSYSAITPRQQSAGAHLTAFMT